jgi:hypothetical protein
MIRLIHSLRDCFSAEKKLRKTSRDRKKFLTNRRECDILNELPLRGGEHEIQKVLKNLKKVLDKLK